MTRSTQIVAVGAYRPEIEVSNDALRARFDASNPGFIDKMEERTSIRTRWYAPEDWTTSDLAVQAVNDALRKAGKTPAEVDLIVLGTDSPDYITPATSVVVQEKLGAIHAGTFDVGCACASFPTALAAAHGLMVTNPALRTVVVVGVYMMHKLADPMDPTIFFYGDGAGAVVLEPSDAPGILGFAAMADGSYSKAWGIYSGGTAEPASVASVREGRTNVRLVGRYPSSVNNEGWPKLTRKLAEDVGFELEDIDLLIFTQVRKQSIELVMAELGLPMEKAHTIMEHTGYTGSACIPMALADALDQGRVNPADLVVLVGSGVGYNQAACAFRHRY